MERSRSRDPRTICAQGTRQAPEIGRPLAPVIVTASTFEFDSQQDVERYYESGRGWIYSRYGNPTVSMAEALLARLEGAEDSVLFGSGMAAIASTVLALGRGGRIAAQREVYGGSFTLLRDLLPGLGIGVSWIDRNAIAALAPSDLAGHRLLLIETPVNPTLRCVDLARTAAVARAAGVPVAVDGTFGTPVLQRPLDLGIDIVLHSATKYLGGHADLIGGAAVGAAERLAPIREHRKFLGGIMDPFTAFLLHRGMRTLAVRMEAHCRGAEAVARALARHPRVVRVHWPGLADHPDFEVATRQMRGFGGMVAFEVAGGSAEAERIHDALELFTRAGSLGGVDSLVSLPARMSHRSLDEHERAQAGVSDGLIRLSVGLEAPDDLVADLERALG